MKDERYEANELSELIDRVVLHGTEAIGVESSLDEEMIALVNDLRAMAQATPMREGFACELKERFLARDTVPAGQHVVGEAPLRRFWPQLVRSFSQHRWATAALGLLLTVAVALAAVGPQRVWADLQRLLGYVPGVGFVNLEDTRVLMAPVEVTRNGVTLRVEQVLAQPDRTVVVIRSQGLPPEDQLWPHGAREHGDFQARLRLPDDSTLTSGTWTLRLGGGTLAFPSLSDRVYRFVLELPRLPLVPANAAPEGWAVPLSLRPATGELVAELFPQPYAPPHASDTHAGIALRVLEVAHSPQETVLRFQVQWRDSDWEFHHIGGDRSPVLRDDLGHVYLDVVPSSSGSSVQTKVIRIPDNLEMTPTPTPTVPTYEQTKAFAPASPSAQRLTLWVDGLEFMVPAEGSFTVDLGDDPQVGDYWPLDVSLTVTGFPVHITGARLVQEPIGLPDGPGQRTVLQFDITPVPDQGDRALRGLHLESETAIFSGSGGGYNYRTRIMRASLDLREGQPIPSGPIRVWVRSAGVLIRGPWTITWTVPDVDEAGQARVTPVTLHPTSASQTNGGLTLRVDEVTLTDRLMAITVELDNPPPGVALSRIPPWNPATRRNELYLEDDRGRRYERTGSVGWQPRREQTSEVSKTSEVSEALVFQPVQPLTRRMTLHAPTVEVTLAGAAAFDVTVPTGLTMEAHPGKVSASAPWGVDIPVEVSGYQLRFTQARLEKLNGTTMLVLASTPFKGQQGDRWLTGLRMASVTAPNGQSVDLRSAFGHAGLAYEGGYGARLAFNVVDPGTGTVRLGCYHVKLDGVTVAVQGPWTLAWNLRAP